MPRFIVFTKLSGAGAQHLIDGDDRLANVRAEVEQLGGKVIEQYALLGPHDFCTIVHVRDVHAAATHGQ